jgi:heptosyltransferase II
MRRVLVVAPSWVGDLVMAQPLIGRLAQNNTLVDVLVPPYCVGLGSRLKGVNQAIPFPFGHGVLKIRERRHFALSEIKKTHYQQAVILPNSFKSALVPFFAGIPQRTGWWGEARLGLLNDGRFLSKKKYPLLVDRYYALGASQDLIVEQAPPPAFNELSVPDHLQAKPILALCPGAEFGPSKQWPIAHFAVVAAHYLRKDWTVWLMGSQKDKAYAEAIAMQARTLASRDAINFCGLSTLEAAIDQLAQSQMVLSNDSGLMHVASALGKPVVGLYGPTDPQYTPPLGKRARVLQNLLPCGPCFKRDCPLSNREEHHLCMRALLPEKVIEELDRACLIG